MKFSTRPISPLHDPEPASPGPDYLQHAMERTLQHEDVVFDFLVQVQADPLKMPVRRLRHLQIPPLPGRAPGVCT
jgi:hypothetical protein